MNQNNKQGKKVALVTGAGRRIGAAIIKQLHAAGYKVVIHCHKSLTEAGSLMAALNQQRFDSAHLVQGDLTEEKTPQALITATLAWGKQLDLLVNNASVFLTSSLTILSDDCWENLFTTNVKAPFLLSLAARPFLEKQQGAIINITDIHAKRPLKNYSAYCQSKAALMMQTKSLAKEFAPNIRVNGVAPGAIAWPENKNQLDAAHKEKIISQTPLKRHGDPRFIAQAVLALAENTFITGQILNVDGGRSL